MVDLVPVPVVITVPGVLVNFHAPVEGKPLRITLPVAKAHVGWVIVPTTGAFVTACVLTVILVDDNDIHPDALVTV